MMARSLSTGQRGEKVLLHDAKAPKAAADFRKTTTVGAVMSDVCQTLTEAANCRRRPRNVKRSSG